MAASMNGLPTAQHTAYSITSIIGASFISTVFSHLMPVSPTKMTCQIDERHCLHRCLQEGDPLQFGQEFLDFKRTPQRVPNSSLPSSCYMYHQQKSRDQTRLACTCSTLLPVLVAIREHSTGWWAASMLHWLYL
ncbi:uncharacterized protein LOC110986173 [Acanthaster planci]|uniref:Uncharacterized protein LOC110986173 n=1 Tax=Acanthaster planci TaxID=133434 RepID=A0A8B7ZJP9_ACAPL|nr:uncharacterized protein LOC110986173 [Acanthaster planci]